MKATLKFTSYEIAKSFATAWSRYSKRGYSLGPKSPDGGAELVLDGVTEADKEWIDSAASTINA